MEWRDGRKVEKPRTKTLRWDELDTFLAWGEVPSEWHGGGENSGGDWEAKERT